MSRALLLPLAAALSLLGSMAHAACEYPDAVAIPDGTTASEQEMLDAQGNVKAYMEKMQAYLACMDQEAEDLGDTETDEQKALHAKVPPPKPKLAQVAPLRKLPSQTSGPPMPLPSQGSLVKQPWVS